MSIRVGGQNFLRSPTAPIHRQVLSGTGRFDVTGIGLGYTNLTIYAWLRSDVVATFDTVELFFNGDTTAANYRRTSHISGDTVADGGADTSQVLQATAASSPANYFATIWIKIPFYNDNTITKMAFCYWITRQSAAQAWTVGSTLHWESTAAINQITVQPDGYAADEFIAGSRVAIDGYR